MLQRLPPTDLEGKPSFVPAWAWKILDGGTRHVESVEERRAVRVANFVILAVSSAMLPYGPIFYLAGLKVLAFAVPLLAVAYTATLWLIRQGRHREGVFAYLTIFNVMTGVYVARLGPDADVDTVYFLNVCLPFLMLPGSAMLGRVYGVSLAIVLYMAAREARIGWEAGLDSSGQHPMAMTLPPMMLMLVALCVWFKVFVNARQSRALIAANERLEEAGRMKNSFLATMSHELRTPLNAVIGFSGILSKNSSGNLDEQQVLFLERISDNGAHLLALINDVLDISKIESGEMSVEARTLQVDEVIDSCISQVGSLAEEAGLTLDVAEGGRDLEVVADPQRLRQVLLNLLGNSIKFTPAGGRVLIERVSRGGKACRIDVVDTGVGIPANRMGQIFDAFRQGDESISREYGGTGLGLAISSRLCELMGFRLVVASEEGAGSTFSILLSDEASPPEHRNLSA